MYTQVARVDASVLPAGRGVCVLRCSFLPVLFGPAVPRVTRSLRSACPRALRVALLPPWGRYGLLGRVALAVRKGMLHCFPLRAALRGASTEWASVSAAARTEVAWWRNVAATWNGICTLPLPLAERPTEPAGRSDACKVAMCGIWFNPTTQEYRYFYHPTACRHA